MFMITLESFNQLDLLEMIAVPSGFNEFISNKFSFLAGVCVEHSY